MAAGLLLASTLEWPCFVVQVDLASLPHISEWPGSSSAVSSLDLDAFIGIVLPFVATAGVYRITVVGPRVAAGATVAVAIAPIGRG